MINDVHPDPPPAAVERGRLVRSRGVVPRLGIGVLVASALVVALPVGLPGASLRSADASACSAGILDAASLAAWQDTNGGVPVGIALTDTSNGCHYDDHGEDELMTASIVKLEVMGGVLLDLQELGTTADAGLDQLLAAMIEESDNSATDALVGWLGGMDALQAVAGRFGLAHTNNSWDGDWGSTLTTANDQVQLVEELLVQGGPLTSEARDIARGYLQRVDPAQRWGVGTVTGAGRSTLVKNGWYQNLPGDNGATDRWRLNSVGLVTLADGREVAIATLGNDWADEGTAMSAEEVIAQRLADAADELLPVSASPVPVPTGQASQLVPQAPIRLLDARDSGAPLVGGTTVSIDVRRNGITPNAVALNLTAVDSAADGYLAAFPSGSGPPATSNVNYLAGRTTANLAVVRVGTDGYVSVLTSATTKLVVDLVSSWVATTSSVSSGRFRAMAPARVLDTRSSAVVAADVTVRVPLAGAIPATASAVALNVTIVQASAAGYWTVWPTGSPRPLVSNVNVAVGDTLANTVIVPVGPDGSVSVYSLSGGHLVVDAVGWFTGATDAAGSDGLLKTFARPMRVVDTRVALGSDRLGTNAMTLPLSTGTGVVGNITWIAPAQAGYLTVWPSGTSRPPVSTANPDPRLAQAWSNAVISAQGAGGGVQVWSLRPTDVVVDLAGVFS